MKKKFLAFFHFFAIVLLSFSSMEKINAYTSLPVNTNNTVTFSYDGQIQYYSIYTSYNTWYAIDVVGNSYLTLEVTDVSNTFRKSGNVFTMEFQSVSSTVDLEIKCTHYVSSTSTIRIRPMVASMYGYNYPSDTLNTTSDLNIPYNVLSNFVHSSKYTDPTSNNKTHMLGIDFRGYPRIDSDVFFFTGHASETVLQMPGPINLDRSEIPTLHTCKIAVLAGCETAKTPSSGYPIAQVFVNCGADASIGWEKVIQASASKTFTDKLFTELANGDTFAQAALEAKNQFLIGNIKKYIIYGNSSEILINSSLVLTYSYDLDEPITNLDDYIIEYSGLDEYRLYRSVNGHISEEFVDCILSNGYYYVVNRSCKNIENKKILNYDVNRYHSYIESLENDFLEYDYQFMYFIEDDYLIPSLVVSYATPDRSDYGEYIINLNNYEQLKFEDHLYAYCN